MRHTAQLLLSVRVADCPLPKQSNKNLVEQIIKPRVNVGIFVLASKDSESYKNNKKTRRNSQALVAFI